MLNLNLSLLLAKDCLHGQIVPMFNIHVDILELKLLHLIFECLIPDPKLIIFDRLLIPITLKTLHGFSQIGDYVLIVL